MVHFTNYIHSGVIGHAIGDALGVPAEFKGRRVFMLNPLTDMVGHGTHNMPVGTWSDDTSMELCLMKSLIDCKSFDYDDIMGNFIKWWKSAEFTATGETFDIGETCCVALNNYLRGRDPLQCGGKDEYNNGNGSLMRILPVAFVCHRNGLIGQAEYELVKNVSSLTHAHEISVLGCYIYTNFICHLLEGEDKKTAYKNTKWDDYSFFSGRAIDVYSRVLKDDISGYSSREIASNGYVVSSLEASLWCVLTTNSYKDAVLAAVNLGNDTDTNGAITGSMAGIIYGYDTIPKEWIMKLLRSDYILDLCDQFKNTEIEA